MLLQDEDGNKMVNEYVRVCKIGAGSYGKVVSGALEDTSLHELVEEINLLFSTGFVSEHCRWKELCNQGSIFASMQELLRAEIV